MFLIFFLSRTKDSVKKRSNNLSFVLNITALLFFSLLHNWTSDQRWQDIILYTVDYKIQTNKPNIVTTPTIILTSTSTYHQLQLKWMNFGLTVLPLRLGKLHCLVIEIYRPWAFFHILRLHFGPLTPIWINLEALSPRWITTIITHSLLTGNLNFLVKILVLIWTK